MNGKYKRQQSLEPSLLQDDVHTSIVLQILLYVNVRLLPIWSFVTIYCLYFKFDELNRIHRIIMVPLILGVISIECVRLFMGYNGNLREKLSDLAGFWIISTVLQFPLICYILFSPYTLCPIVEKLFYFAVAAMSLIEIFVSFFVVKRLSHYTALKYCMEAQIGVLCKANDGIRMEQNTVFNTR
ncbi:transmembrane protein 17-like [Ctenocephalides felis]|uniref:transmembrane protein 17-like n=1 Tax=Ctenocephalides felis TaxID=7515 RepID=UPI000E6E4BE2|nr:transmembrane protein 17-like [Ctenocephalides felis]